MDTARRVLDLVLGRPPTLGGGRLVCLDGPAGSGKTTLAARVAALVDDSRIVSMDDLYAGWSGLGAAAGQLDTLLDPLAHGRPGRYRRWDWHASAYAADVEVAPVDLLVVEGVGAWHPAHAAQVTALVWVTAPAAVRTARVLARDGEVSAPHLRRWQAAESAHHAALGTRESADVVLAEPSRP